MGAPKKKTVLNPTTPKAPPKRAKKLVAAPTVPDCCAACFSLEPGQWGVPWYNAGTGTWQCLAFPEGGGAMYLKGDATGPYWSNA